MYLGCYEDQAERDLEGGMTELAENSVESCRNTCLEKGKMSRLWRSSTSNWFYVDKNLNKIDTQSVKTGHFLEIIYLVCIITLVMQSFYLKNIIIV